MRYKRSLVTFVDILGFSELIDKREPKEISEIILTANDELRPYSTGMSKPPNDDFVNFSDMNITATPLDSPGARLTGEILFKQLMHLVHAQSNLVTFCRIVVRGGVTVGNIVNGQRQLFGPAVVRAHELESKIAVYPRIVVGREVLDELKEQSDAGTSGPPGEDPRSLLREGDDGQFYVDYLWARREAAGEQFREFLDLHGSFISDSLNKYSDRAAIRAKYEWLDHYQRSVLDRLNGEVS